MKECGNPECTRVYTDRSLACGASGAAWSPAGDKIKAAAYRARKKTVPVR